MNEEDILTVTDALTFARERAEEAAKLAEIDVLLDTAPTIVPPPMPGEDVFAPLNAMADECYAIAASKGWHESSVPIANYVANLHGEVSELWEAYRRNALDKPCDKDTALTCLEEEVADIVIRALDMACDLGVDVARAVSLKCAYNRTRQHRHGKVA